MAALTVLDSIAFNLRRYRKPLKGSGTILDLPDRTN